MAMTRLLFYCGLLPITTIEAFGIENSRVFVSTPVSNYPKRLVGDCMSRRPPATLSPDQTVDEAMGYLLDLGESGAVVLDDNDSIVGIVTSFDFLQKEAFGGSLLPMEGSVANIEKYVEAAKKICGKTVADIMTPNPTTISQTASMREAAMFMTELRIQRLPVVGKDGKLVGILSSIDVMRDLRRIIRNLPASKEPDDVEVEKGEESNALSS